MSNYKLIACDLDGTLIGTDMTLSEENRRAIKELTQQGVLIVPATGRTICEMEEVFNLPEIRYIIYSNGAAIYDKKTGDNILLGLDADNTRFVFSAISKYDAFWIIHKDGKSYADKEKAKKLKDYHVNFNVRELVRKYCILIDNPEKDFFNGELECVVTFFSSKDERDSFRKILSSNSDLFLAEGWDYNFEIFFKGAGKGYALKTLAEKLNINMGEVISIGDSDNDRQMTIMAGLGLVTENGSKSLKEIADKVICSNDEHVMDYVKRFF